MAFKASWSNLLLQAPIHVRDPLMRKRIHWHQNVSIFPPNSSVDTDSLSVMVHSDEELLSDCEALDTALKPPVRANEPPTTVFEPQSGANKPPDEAVKRPNVPTVSANAGDLYDPDSQHATGVPQADLTAFFGKILPSEVILRPSKRHT